MKLPEASIARFCSLLAVIALVGSSFVCVKDLRASDLDASAQTPSVQAAVKNSPRLVLKHGSHFLVMDEAGMMPGGTNFGYGLYVDDTRYLSGWSWTINGAEPTLLAASTEEGYAGHFSYSNKEVGHLPEQKLLFQREVLINNGVFEKITLTNFDLQSVDVNLALNVGADFADMFEVRGMSRKRRGQLLRNALTSDAQGERNRELLMAYRGLDGAQMNTAIHLPDHPGISYGKGAINVPISLKPRETRSLQFAVRTSQGAEPPTTETTFEAEKSEADQFYKDWRDAGAHITTDNTALNSLIERSFRDLFILRQATPRGYCLAAGVPWFAVAFGRDQEVTALQTMPFLPHLSREIISCLAAYQGTKSDTYTEEAPGRIMHELRVGEMARNKEIPFIPYYGTVDATPLFPVVCGKFLEATGDKEFLKEHWKNVESAMSYVQSQRKGGYLRYGGKEGAALSNQGWKDSGNSIMYSNGILARPPIALSEVQGYVYWADREAAYIANALDKKSEAEKLLQDAAMLKEKFTQEYWMRDKSYFALALDGNDRPCDVIASNPGHLLLTGILNEAQSAAVTSRLMSESMFSGWGVRTLSAKETAYNPMSYHNGSVWPHDNGMIAEGLALAGKGHEARKIFGAMIDVARTQPDMRLPELFCGFPRSVSGDRPVWYPVSCSPQAWAAGSILQMLRSCIGLHVDALNHRLTVTRPTLPPGVTELKLTRLPVGKSRIDLLFRPRGGSVDCKVLTSTGDVMVRIVK